MRINADFSIPVLVSPEQQQWVASPQAGVERVMLDRIGVEKARATSLVRYAANSHFPVHEHPAGEEIFVLSGHFCADGICYGPGTYLRNPPGSSHQPYSDDGTVIFVKLMQMLDSEQASVCIDTTDSQSWQQTSARRFCLLFENAQERVELIELPANGELSLALPAGAELLMLDGQLSEQSQLWPMQLWQKLTWARFPANSQLQAHAGELGARFYLKTGHLA
jgi:anti-sigma factor ChrR (cupin superfamily)